MDGTVTSSLKFGKIDPSAKFGALRVNNSEATQFDWPQPKSVDLTMPSGDPDPISYKPGSCSQGVLVYPAEITKFSGSGSSRSSFESTKFPVFSL
jgi:hypothetical protein